MRSVIVNTAKLTWDNEFQIKSMQIDSMQDDDIVSY